MGSWEKSLEDLIAGNERFMNDEIRNDRSFEAQRRLLFEEGQKPLAVIVCASDAYLSPELIFDSDLGDLYVLRMPRLEITKEVLEGIEFAVEKLDAPLCMILGCPGRNGDPVLYESGFWQLFARSEYEEDEERIKECVQRVRDHSEFEDKISRGELFVVGAKYDLESGNVAVFDFFDE